MLCECQQSLRDEFSRIVKDAFKEVLGRQDERIHVSLGHGTVGESLIPNGTLILSANTSVLTPVPEKDEVARILAHLKTQIPMIEFERYSFRLTIPRGQKSLIPS